MRAHAPAILAFALLGAARIPAQPADPEYRHASEEAYERWRDLKYGLRIHWGYYSLLGVEASWPVRGMPDPEKAKYFDLFRRFDPAGFDAEAWMGLMERCGLRFFTFTSKHHDGFSMFDTETRVTRRVDYAATGGRRIEACDIAYSAMDAPCRRDIVKELCDAAHRHGIAIDLYFSHIDWYDADFRFDPLHPAYDKTYTRASDPAGYGRAMARHREQIREILTRYGKIDMLCLDMSLPEDVWPEMVETVKMARRLQPDVLMRDRGIGAYGDYTTPENWIPSSEGLTDKRVDKPWMVIHTLSNQFAFDPDGSKYRSGEWIVSNLIDIVAKGGNFMVSIGPDASGRFHPDAMKHLEYAGEWLRVNGEAIYGTRPWRVYREGAGIRVTRSKDGRFVYAIALAWPGERLVLSSVRPREGTAIRLLGVPEPMRWRIDAEGQVVIEIPAALQDPARRPCKQAYAFRIEVEPGAAGGADRAALPDWAMGPFVRHEKPVLSPIPEPTFACPVSGKTVHWEIQNVYNPAAVVRDGRVHLLYRADDDPRPQGWGRTCRTGYATSADARTFARSSAPVLYPDNDEWKRYEWEGGCEDIHVIEGEDGTYYANYTAWSGTGDAMIVATSPDLRTWTKRGPAFAKAFDGRFVGGSRTGAVVCRRDGDRLIATRIRGRYWMYWRLGCFLATSDDLIDWTPIVDANGALVSFLPGRRGRFDSGSCEAGAIALRTDAGILLFYNGANLAPQDGGDPAFPSGWPGIGQALFDRDDPTRLLARLDQPILRVETPWEREGFTGSAVVSNGLVFFRGEWLLYYGAADRCIGLAVFRPAGGMAGRW